MADTLNESLVKVTSELKEANQRSLEATKELGKVTAAQKGEYKEIGAAVKEAVGIDKLKDAVMNLPGMNVAKAIGNVVMKKRREKQEQTNLAKRLGITRDQLLLQKAEQELVLARKEEQTKLIEAAEKLGFNADQIKGMNEEGNVEIKNLRESNGQFISAANASSEDNLRALKDFGKGISDKMPEPPTLAKPGPGGAALVEDAAEERSISNAALSEQEKQTSLLERILGVNSENLENGEKSGGGFLEKLGALRLAIMGLPALIGAKLVALKAFAGTAAKAVGTVAGTVARGVGTVAKSAMPIAKAGLRGIASAARFAGPIGLAVTAAMGIFDGMSAGIEEYKKSGKLGAAVKEGIAGAASGLTFGLVSQESISAGMDKIGTFFSDGWTSFTDGVSTIAGGIADFAKDPLGTMSEVGTAISTKFTETVTSIKEGATALNTKFADLTGIDIGAGFKATTDLIKSGAAALGTKFTELTGIEIPTDFASLKTSIVAGAAAIGTKFTELTGIEIPTDFASLKTSIVTGASALGTKFTELTGIDIGETFTGLKDKVLGVATSLNTKFTEVTGIDIGESLTGVKDSILGLGTKISEGFTGLFGEEGFSVEGVKNAISGIGSAISGKFTELTGVELPTFEDVKSGIAGIGASIAGGLTALGVPTFSEVTGKMSALATGLAERVGIELPTFDEAKSAVGNLAAGLGSKISGMWDSVTGLFKTADEKQAKIDQRNALEQAKESGLYTERGVRKSLIDDSQLAGASDVQLQAIINDDDLSSDNMKKVQAELASRTSAEPTVETASSSFDGSTEVRRKNGQIEMMNIDQIDTALNLKKITNMEANAARNRISEEKSTRPAPPSISADAKQDMSSALGMGSQSIPAAVETAALSATTTASTLTYVPSSMNTAQLSSNAAGIGAGTVMQSDAVQVNTQRTMLLQQQGLETASAVAQAPVQAMMQNVVNNNITNNNTGNRLALIPTGGVQNTTDGSFNPMND